MKEEKEEQKVEIEEVYAQVYQSRCHFWKTDVTILAAGPPWSCDGGWLP